MLRDFNMCKKWWKQYTKKSFLVYDGLKEYAFEQHVDKIFVALNDTLKKLRQHDGTNTWIKVVMAAATLKGKDSVEGGK